MDQHPANLTSGDKGKRAETKPPQQARNPAPKSQGGGGSLLFRAAMAIVSGVRRAGRNSVPPPTTFVQRDGREIEYHGALKAKTKIVDAWRANRRLLKEKFKTADVEAKAASSPRPKFVMTRYRAWIVVTPQGRVRTKAGNEIDRRGLLNYHYRSDGAARKDGMPRTLSQFSRVNTDGAVSGASNTVTRGPRNFILRVPKHGSTLAAAAEASRELSAKPSKYADLKSFVPAIYVKGEEVGIARNAGVPLQTMLAECGPLPLQSFRQASKDLDALNARGISFSDLYLKNLTVADVDGQPTVRFIDCDMMPKLRRDNRYLDAGKFVRCVYGALAPRERTDQDVDRFVEQHVKPEFRREVSDFLHSVEGAKIRHSTEKLFAWE